MKEVIILGGAKSREMCSYHCETWGVNFLYTIAKKLDKLFFTDEEVEIEAWQYKNLDRLSALKPTLVFPVAYRKFKAFGLPIEIYPFEDIKAKFRTDYFSSSIAYMIAYALYYGYEKIWLYGVEFDSFNFEYEQEKAGTEYWIGMARGLGAEVIIPKGVYLAETWTGRPYGEFGKREGKPDMHFLESRYDKVSGFLPSDYRNATLFLPGQIIDFPGVPPERIHVLEAPNGIRLVKRLE